MVLLEPGNAESLVKVSPLEKFHFETIIVLQIGQVMMKQREADVPANFGIDDIEHIFRTCISLEGMFSK